MHVNWEENSAGQGEWNIAQEIILKALEGDVGMSVNKSL